MNYSKFTDEELREKISKLKEEIAGLEHTLENMPIRTFLGRLSVTGLIKRKVKERNDLINELHSRSI
jgi:hypothetical protein